MGFCDNVKLKAGDSRTSRWTEGIGSGKMAPDGGCGLGMAFTEETSEAETLVTPWALFCLESLQVLPAALKHRGMVLSLRLVLFPSHSPFTNPLFDIRTQRHKLSYHIPQAKSQPTSTDITSNHRHHPHHHQLQDHPESAVLQI